MMTPIKFNKGNHKNTMILWILSKLAVILMIHICIIYEEDIGDIWLTDGNGGGGLRGPTIGEFAITPKHMFVLI